MKKFEIFQEVIRRFNQKEEIEDEMCFCILENMAERFVESHEDSEWHYDRLLTELDKIWHYEKCDELSSKQSYLYGGIWGGLRMLSFIKKKKQTSQKCRALASKYETDTSYVFLNSIYNNPGVQNKKLAELCSVTPARISQIASEALREGLISARVFGKEKSYFIRTLGEGVYDVIQERKDKLTQNVNPLDYKVLVFSNKDNGTMKIFKAANFMNEQLRYKNIVAIAVAYEQKGKMLSYDDFNLGIRREKNLWIQPMSNFNKGYKSFWEPQMEADLINRR